MKYLIMYKKAFGLDDYNKYTIEGLWHIQND